MCHKIATTANTRTASLKASAVSKQPKRESTAGADLGTLPMPGGSQITKNATKELKKNDINEKTGSEEDNKDEDSDTDIDDTPFISPLINWQNAFYLFLAIIFTYHLISNFMYLWIGSLIPIVFTLWLSFYIPFSQHSPGSSGKRNVAFDSSMLAAKFPRFKFTSSESWKREEATIKDLNTPEELSIYPENFLINDTLNHIVSLVIRDFVQSWFIKITRDASFTTILQKELGSIIVNLQLRLKSTDFTDLVVFQLVPLFNDHFDKFVLAHEVVKGKKTVVNRSLMNTWDLDNIIATSFNKGKLHPAIRMKSIDRERDVKLYMVGVVGKLIPLIVDESEINSPPVFVLIREIVTNCVLYPVIKLFSDPDFYNKLIVETLGGVMKDRADVKRFRNVLDKQSLEGNQDTQKKKKSKASLMAKYGLTAKSDTTTYERILRKVNGCESKAELQQYKYYYFLKIQKLAKEVDDGVKDGSSERFKVYEQRLQAIHSAAEQRLLALVSMSNSASAPNKPKNGGTGGSSRGGTDSANTSASLIPRINLDLTLSKVLNDPQMLSYFTEFMEQRRRTPLLQYWLIVQGIRDPLENSPLTEQESDSDDEDIISNDAQSKEMAQADDIKQIFYQFFTNKLLKIDSKCFSRVSQFVSHQPYDPQLYTKARRSLLFLQQKIYERMDKSDFVAFRQSEMFLKLLAAESQYLQQQQAIDSHNKSTTSDLQDGLDEEINGDPLANYEEEGESGDENDDLKISAAVMNAVTNALAKITTESPSQFRVPKIQDL
ncbi:unnamed protein product [Ambrosiozyma monospora]|uniref:Unnamed protein product n=1 Tax=Ambrosiozyma monospora TaxID=43982 RepID=A0A9W6Z3U5_AMBMO|nr:unnamed protein product [Ambrosiozyma monospora]